ncbi:MFS transporter [Pseudomonas veronii]|uniref:MFS transporter n=1 Tax=Pseudomonas veronii TaxID=76761 RepID=UPI0021C1C5E0|nr:MFS transporter [Pseudomonas veronii]MCT9826624.1 MFS transporter [Pseudomonas veronii]
MSTKQRIVKYPIYTIGDLSSGIYALGPAILLLFYMTNILGVPIEIATIAAALPKFLDLIFSPVIGAISDRTNSKMGRRRPFLLLSAILVLPLFVGIWAAPFKEPILSAWFIGIAYAACSLCYTAFLVPYCALNSEIAKGYKDSTTLNSYRATYSMLGCLVAGACAPLLVDLFGGGRNGYFGMGVSLAAIMSASMLVTFSQSKEPPRRVHAEKITLKQMSQALITNKAFFVLTVTYVLHMIGGAVISTALAYYVTYILVKDTSLLAGIFLLMFGASVVTIPLFLAIGRKLGKHTSFSLCLLISIAAASLFFFLDSSTDVKTAYSAGFAIGFAEGAIQAYAYAMLADCLRQGDQRQGALLSGVFIAFERMALASGSLLAGTTLAIAGLVETVDGTVIQPDSALLGIKFSMTVVPITLNFIALLTFSLYRNFDSKISQIDETEPDIDDVLHNKTPLLSRSSTS